MPGNPAHVEVEYVSPWPIYPRHVYHLPAPFVHELGLAPLQYDVDLTVRFVYFLRETKAVFVTPVDLTLEQLQIKTIKHRNRHVLDLVPDPSSLGHELWSHRRR